MYTALLLVASLMGYAQAPSAAPPVEVDQALRAQATAFLKYQTEGNFRKAYELVAEDSQDYYLGAPKEKSASLDLQKIQYSDNFTRAVVTSASKQVLVLEGRSVEVPSIRTDRWKMENGQWKWYHDASKEMVPTLLGPIPAGPSGSSTAPAPQLPKELNPEKAAAAIQSVARPTSPRPAINRRSVPFAVDKEATEEIVYYNNSPGEIRIEADLITDFPGFVVQPKKFLLKAKEETTFKITYHPSGKGVFNAALRFTIQPFDREVKIPLILSADPAATKP
jgi:hypothetical protein